LKLVIADPAAVRLFSIRDIQVQGPGNPEPAATCFIRDPKRTFSEKAAETIITDLPIPKDFSGFFY
jgi:hypothetical protein